MGENIPEQIDTYLKLWLTPIPLKPRSKEPQARWRTGWYASPDDLRMLASQPEVNWAVRCGPELVVLDFDDPDGFHRFVASLPLPADCPIVRTSMGFHVWLRPKRPVATQRLDGLEVKGGAHT